MTAHIDNLSDDLVFDTPAKAEPTVDININAVAIRTNIGKVQQAMTEFDAVSAGLSDIAARYPADLVYDVSTGKGMVEAIAHRAAWRDPRLAVERLRKQAKAPVIALGKDIDARAAWLTEQLLLGEVPIDQQIKAEEARKEAEKQARIHAEFERVQKIEDAIGEIHMDVMVAAGKPSATILAALEALRTQTLDPLVFQDRMPQAEAARAAGVAKLEIAYKAKLHDEEEAARLAAERAELAELRAAAAAQKAKDAEAAKVEQARVAEEQRIEREKLAAERAEMNRQRAELAAARAESDRLQAEATRRALEAEQTSSEPAPVAEAPAKPVITVDLEAAEPFVPPISEDPTLTLGDIKDKVAPLSITAEGLAQLGFAHAATKGAAKLYLPSSWPAMRAAMVKMLEAA